MNLMTYIIFPSGAIHTASITEAVYGSIILDLTISPSTTSTKTVFKSSPYEGFYDHSFPLQLRSTIYITILLYFILRESTWDLLRGYTCRLV